MKKNIVLLEDSNFVRSLVKHALAEKGFNVFEVDSSYKLMHAKKFNSTLPELGLLDKIKPDLFIIDIEIKGDMNGIEVLKKLRAHSDFKDVPAIVNSSHKDKETIIMAISSGASDYVLKEDNFVKVLAEKVNRLFEKETSSFESTLVKELDWISYGQKELSFAMLSVKKGEDSKAPLGDELIEQVLEAIRSKTRSYDWVFHLDDYNFAVIMPLSNVHSLVVIKDRLVNGISALADSLSTPLNVKAGFSHYPTNAQTSNELITIAKKQLG